MYGNYPFVSSPQIYKFSGNKKIKWIFNLTDNDFFIIKEELFKVTEDNSTVIIKNIKYENEKLFYDIEKIMNLSEIKTIKIIEKLLEK